MLLVVGVSLASLSVHPSTFPFASDLVLRTKSMTQVTRSYMWHSLKTAVMSPTRRFDVAP